MALADRLTVLAVRQLLGGVWEVIGLKAGGAALEAAANFLAERLTDQSQRLNHALDRAHARAWKALEVALAGPSLWERCKQVLSKGDDKAFARQVRAFLDATPFVNPADRGGEFQRQCLRELRAAAKAGLLTPGAFQPQELARQTADFARFSDPQHLAEAEWQLVVRWADEFRQLEYSALADYLALRPAQGLPLIVLAVRYFFRREVETDPQLYQGLSWAKLEQLGKEQEAAFAGLAEALQSQGERLETLLADVKGTVEETHGAVLRIEDELARHGDQVRELGRAVLLLLEQYQVRGRELRAGDSLSMRAETDRKQVQQLSVRYRALPDAEKRELPGLLQGLGKLEVLAGDFEGAQRDFQAAATLATTPAGQAEAHYHAYRAALERRDFDAALKEILAACQHDARRFMPFPMGKYQPQRILGAGGFGVAFLCQHRYMNAPVVIKSLLTDDLERGIDQVFAEAQALRQLDHGSIIKVSDCGYVDAGKRSRPFLVMDYFDGATLEDHVRKHGPLAAADFLALAAPVAEGLRAAHGRGILHRDVKPANLLVRKEAVGWQARLIDFGLAFRWEHGHASTQATAGQRTVVGASIAGTIDYAAPEQMGKLPGVAVGPAADVYGFGRLACYALCGTPNPLPKHWRSLPDPLVTLLEKCLAEHPGERPTDLVGDLRLIEATPEPILDALPVLEGFGERGALAPRGNRTDRVDHGGLTPPARRKGRGVPAWVWVVVIGLVGVILVVVFGLWYLMSDSKQVARQHDRPEPMPQATKIANPEPPAVDTRPNEPQPEPPPVTKKTPVVEKKPPPVGPDFPALAERLKKHEWGAAEALVNIPVDAKYQKEVSGALVQMLYANNYQGWYSACQALKVWACPDNGPELVKAFHYVNDSRLKGGIVELIGIAKDPRTADALTAMLGMDGYMEGAYGALRSIGKAAEKSVLKYMNHGDYRTADYSRKLLKQYATPEADLLEQAIVDLGSKDVGVRRAVTDWLGSATVIEGRRAAVALALDKLLLDPDQTVSDRSLKALKTWATKDNIPSLIRVLNGAGGPTQPVIDALGQLKDIRAAEALASRLDHGGARGTISRTLQTMGPLAEKPVLQQLQSNVKEVRLEACTILTVIGGKDSLVELVKVRDGDTDANIRRAADTAVKAIEARGGPT